MSNCIDMRKINWCLGMIEGVAIGMKISFPDNPASKEILDAVNVVCTTIYEAEREAE